jgi:Holliday junction resolvasome RuvABC DNA-binding subunit
VKWRVWHLAGQGRTVETIVDEFAKQLAGIGAKYADRLLKEVERSFDKWTHNRKSTTGQEHTVANHQGGQGRAAPHR